VYKVEVYGRAHRAGDAQADFCEVLVVIGGVEQKAHSLCVDLPHSDDCFVAIFPAENTESFCEGHNQAFAYFGGVPRTILYDNTGIAVVEITGDGERKPTEEFRRLKSHYLFEAKFGRPGKGNDKGNVEGLVGYARRNFMAPAPLRSRGDDLRSAALSGLAGAEDPCAGPGGAAGGVGSAGGVRGTAAADGSAAGQTGAARVCAGAAAGGSRDAGAGPQGGRLDTSEPA